MVISTELLLHLNRRLSVSATVRTPIRQVLKQWPGPLASIPAFVFPGVTFTGDSGAIVT